MKNRVSYLEKEEQKVIKKISKTRTDAERHAHIKSEKVLRMQEKLALEKREAAQVRAKAEQAKS